MSDAKYIILQPIQPPKKCYLLEILYWRAFGRFPEILYYLDGQDARFSEESCETIEANFPEFREITDEESRFAGLPPDPRSQMTDDDYYLEENLEYYQTFVQMVESADTPDPVSVAKARQSLSDYMKTDADFKKWVPLFTDYIDQFENEICLMLRRGALVAYGIPIPKNSKGKDGEASHQIEDCFDEDWPDKDSAILIPPEQWVSSHIQWKDNILEGHAEGYIWVHVKVEDMLRQFPPTMVLDRDQILAGGDTYAVSSSIVPGIARQRSRRGRPPLPWDSFHVQVARLYRDGEMPEKKEAAIAFLQEWFENQIGRTVSRSAIGQKLKPYFDELSKKDRK